jgi:hypothetical protein
VAAVQTVDVLIHRQRNQLRHQVHRQARLHQAAADGIQAVEVVGKLR